jgi:hypothetical protein
MQAKVSHGKIFELDLPAMKHDVVLAPGVEVELQEILDYLESKAGLKSANQFMKAFSSMIESISNFPASISSIRKI